MSDTRRRERHDHGDRWPWPPRPYRRPVVRRYWLSMMAAVAIGAGFWGAVDGVRALWRRVVR